MKKMSFESIFNWLYAKTLDRATNHSVYRPVSVSYMSRISLIALLLLVLGGWNSEAWGGLVTPYAKVIANSVPNTDGYVYVGTDSECSSSNATKTSDDATNSGNISWNDGDVDFWLCAKAKDGYGFSGWRPQGGSIISGSTAVPYKITVNGGERDRSGSLWSGYTYTVKSQYTYTYEAIFEAITVSSAGNADAISFNHPETKTVTLKFPVSSFADETADFNKPTSSGNGWKVTSWSLNTSTHEVEVVCSFTANADTAKGDYEATITLKAKSNNSNTGTVKASVDLTPTLTYNNTTLDVSVSDADKTTLDVTSLLTAYKGADNVAGDGAITYALKSTSSVASVTSAGVFYAKALGTYTIVATAAKGRYYAKTAEFTITVNKRTPTFEWWNANGATHIYASDVLENVAQAKYNENNVGGLKYSYESNKGIVVVDGTTLRVQNAGFTEATEVTISVATEETNYYKEGSDTHTYLIEPKATPELWLNETINLPADPVQELHLLVGETATMRFVNTDESNNRFTYPTNPTYVSYAHNSSEHTGVITAVKAGDEEIQFHQTGTTTIFDHLRKIHVYVSKHDVNLATTLDGGTWKVDSIYDGAVYSIVTPTGDQPALSEVSVTSSNEAVLKKVDGHWKAVGEGEATLTISHPNTNDYWAGQTVTATITVVKHTPKFTWHLPAKVNYNRSFAEPVSSTNTDEGCTFTYESNNKAAINYVNGALKTFEKTANNVAITVTQAGNYKWAEHSETFYVNVEKLANHVELTVNSQAIYNAVYSNNSGEVYYDATSGIRLGGSSGSVFPINDKSIPAYNWDDKYIIITFEGVPDKVSFSYRTNNSSATGANWYVQESANGVNGWSEIWSNGDYNKTSYASVTKSLKPSTRYLKLCYSGNFAGYFQNVHITERTEITGVKTVDFGATDAGSNPTDKNSNISWYNVNPLTLNIEGENASQFTVSPAEIASAKDAFAENVPLTISYKHNRAAVKDTATLVITDGTITKRIGLRGTTNKLTPAITWKENLTPMQRGVGVKNPATSPVALTYTSTDPAVVAVIGDSIAPLKKGNATITASFDGTSDPMYNSNSSSIDVVVTDMKVQHINWTQTFKRLKWTDDEELSAKNTPDFPLEAKVSYYDADKKEEIIIDRPIKFTSNDNSVVQMLNGTTLHVVGTGTTTLEAHVEGITDSLYEATAVRDVIVREPSTDCEAWVLEDKNGSINTISSKEFTLTGEGDSIYFEAWREPIKVVIEYTNGDLYLAEVYADGSEKQIWQNETPKNTPASYKCAISREAKKVKFYTVVGATGYHNFSDVYVRRARYVELENTKGKTTHSVHFSTADAKPGVAKTKSFTVNYSNITDQLEMELKGGESSKFSVVSPTSKTIGTDCGEYGTVSVQVQFLSNEVESYKDTLVIHNLNQSVEVYLSAEVDKHHQQITWNPATTELKTTDAVTFDATTSAAAAGLNVRYEVVEGDVATVNAETGALTIIKDGSVTIKATATGNNSYYDAEPISKTFTISKVTPTIIAAPTAATMTLPNTSLADCELTGGEASVAGSFAWADNTINAVLNNEGYSVIFTPENTNWYAATTCVVVVPVNKASQTIVWDFNELEMYCNAQITFDAHSSTGLAELPVSYTTSDDKIAYVDGNNHLNIIKGGEITITATQGGNAIYAAAEPVSKTLTINRFAPTIVSLPNASTMKIGRVLSDASLTGGRAELNGVEVEGSFAWVDGNTTAMNVAGTFSKQIVFIPGNTNFYESVSTTMDVTVEKYAPVITHNLQGSGITYGQPLSESVISGTITATDNVKIPSVNVEGTYAWSNPEQIVNAGENTTALVRFTPANMDWYEAVDVAVPLTVAKAAPVLNATASEIQIGQTLSRSVITNNGTPGICEWAEELDAENRYYNVDGTYENLAYVFRSSDPNYTDGAGVVTLHVNAGFVFNGNDGNGDWETNGNWLGGGQPGSEDNVLIRADVEIYHDIEIAAMTIETGSTVIVKEGATLTVKNGDVVTLGDYGNLIVEAGGQVNMTNGTLHVHDFTLKATLSDGETPGMSGQVNNPNRLAVVGNAYFDLALDPSGQCSQGWYDFTVPFPVDAVNGVTRFRNSTHEEYTIRNEVNYAIMDFSESRRIETGYGWKKFHSIMQPGQCYTITIDSYDNVYRFRKTANGAFNTQMSEPLAYTDADNTARGWNGLGNGTLAYATLSSEGIDKVQLYSHATNSYTAVQMTGRSYAVGSAYFVQAPSANSVLNYTRNNNSPLNAPQRQLREVSEFMLTLTAENAPTIADRLFVGANEDAADSYEIGRDLTKFGNPAEAKVAQMWAVDYNGLRLCDIEMPLTEGNAQTVLGFYAPQTGTYILAANEAPEDVHLYLTYNGSVIWDLTASPYSLDLPKGMTEGYGLQMEADKAPQITTGVENTPAEDQARKVIIDNTMYIITKEGAIFNATGKKVQ